MTERELSIPLVKNEFQHASQPEAMNECLFSYVYILII